jgi:RNA polymerase primary sigma factor
MELFTLQEQSDRIAWLLDEAQERGYLTVEMIIDLFPEVEDDLPQLEVLLARLHEQGIEIYDSQEDAEDHGDGEEKDVDLDADLGDAPDLSRISVDDQVGLYFKEMSSVPLLTREEEIDLAKKMERGQEARGQLARDGHDEQEQARLKRLIEQGQEARHHLVRANTRLVVSIAKKYRGNGLSFLDLIQAGNEGLIKAADKFDYHRGNKFGTYATWWIRQSITRSLSQQGRAIRVPAYLSDHIRRLHRVAIRLEQEQGHEPTPEQIAEELELEPERVRWILRVSRRPLSLEKPVGEDGDTELGSFIEDDNLPAPVETVERHLLRSDLEQMLAALPPREARVLRLRYGMQDGRTRTLKEVGDKLGVSRERARQIERQALRRLRHPRHRRILRSYLG